MGLFHKKSKAPKGRRGIIEDELSGSYSNPIFGTKSPIHVQVQYVVEELERIGNLSRIVVRSLSGPNSSDIRRAAIRALPEWIETDRVKWLEG